MKTLPQLEYCEAEQNGNTRSNSWKLVRLGELAEINPRRPAGLDRADGQPTMFVPMAAVDEQHGVIASAETKPYGEVKKGYTYFAEGDVLFAKITPCMQNGKHAIARELIDGIGFGTTEFHVIRPGTDLLAEWAHFYIRQPRILGEAMAHFTGAVGQLRVPKDFLVDLEIPLPPLTEQRRIAGILKEQLAAVERARAAGEAQLEAAKALPAAYLRDVFAAPDEANFNRRPIGDVCQLLPSKSIATAGDTEVRAITTACLTESGFDPSGIKNARMWSSDAEVCVVSPNEVLIARSNTTELVGRVAMFPGKPSGTVASDLTIRIWAGEKVAPQFLTTYLSFLYVTGYWREKAGGASGSMKKITRSQISALPIPVPEMDEQRAVVNSISMKMSQVRELETILQNELQSIEVLPASLLRSAFQGQL